MAVLKLEDGAFVATDDETTIDFSTQTDFSGDTNPDGTITPTNKAVFEAYLQ